MNQSSPDKKTILIVEDEADTSTYLSTFLEDNGYATITAGDGREGLDLARAKGPDLILLDLMMPGQTGTDFFRNFLKAKELADTPIVVVSGAAGKHLAVKGAAAVLGKPIDRNQLLATVTHLLADS